MKPARVSGLTSLRTELSLSDEDGWDLPAGHPEDFTSAPERAPAPAPMMRGKLLPEEIEALLRPDLSDLPPPPPEPARITARVMSELETAFAPPTPADTAEADAIEAGRLTARLSLALRKSCGLLAAARADRFQRTRFAEAFNAQGVARGGAVLCLHDAQGELAAMLVLTPALVHLILDSAFGGQGLPGAPQPLGPISAAALEHILAPLAPALGAELTLARIETDPDFAAALAGPGAALSVDLTLRLAREQAGARLILRETQQTQTAEAPLRSDHSTSPQAGHLVTVLTARLASIQVPVSRLADLKAGATLLLGVPADQPLQLLSGGRSGPVVAEGSIGRKGNAIALRVTRILPR